MKLERVPWGHRVQPSAESRNPNRTPSDRGLSNYSLECLRVEMPTPSQGHRFHCHTALTVKKVFPDICLKLVSCSLSPWWHVLHSGMIENRSWPSSIWLSFKYLKNAIVSHVVVVRLPHLCISQGPPPPALWLGSKIFTLLNDRRMSSVGSALFITTLFSICGAPCC